LTIRVQEADGHIRDTGYLADYDGYCRISLPGRYTTICHGFIKLEIPAQSEVQVSYRIPVGQKTSDLPDRLLILGKDERGVEELYIFEIMK
jgi:hypothetical protein